jgi:RNA polymerase sigma factor (sigma-70 family)
MELDGPTDEASLLRRLREGDGAALRGLMSRYDGLVRYAVFRMCRTECRRDGEFLDARASEVWYGFVDSVRRHDAALPRNLKSYLIQIVRNKCTDALRRGGRAEADGHDLGGVEAIAEPAVESLIRSEQVLALRGCMASLSDEEKMIYDQLDLILEGRWKQAGEVLNLPESTLRTRWPGILERLRKCVEGKTGKSSAPQAQAGDS